ncbi:hypothetical protein N7983_27335 [Priestia megaterium]|uniref:nuclear transport factor 2 family protein n=1 Tax=Priestia megaterium TaxID=1404 RepID=UPI0021D67086|nr:hypothetical protein [Priestia megaterium]MCU7741276.1 hypothetical protein [Priestia megaterium]MCU7745126.1 hypothetical protein [Priestia megaterium]MCU7746792.1 hypothetical protein [Priestia megaterium]
MLNEKTEKTREIAKKFLETLFKGDVIGIGNMFEGSDAGWKVLGDNRGFPVARKYGPNEIGDLIKAVSPAAARGGDVDVLGVFADGDRAFVEIHAKGTSFSGKSYDNRVLFSIHTGETGILLIEEYLDTRHLHELLFDTNAE